MLDLDSTNLSTNNGFSNSLKNPYDEKALQQRPSTNMQARNNMIGSLTDIGNPSSYDCILDTDVTNSKTSREKIIIFHKKSLSSSYENLTDTELIQNDRYDIFHTINP